MFGVVGVPIVEVAIAAQQHGIHYVGMRNEQSVGGAEFSNFLNSTPPPLGVWKSLIFSIFLGLLRSSGNWLFDWKVRSFGIS